MDEITSVWEKPAFWLAWWINWSMSVRFVGIFNMCNPFFQTLHTKVLKCSTVTIKGFWMEGTYTLAILKKMRLWLLFSRAKQSISKIE